MNTTLSLLVKETAKASLSSCILAALLFVSAGRIDWGMAWVYIGMYSIGTIITGVVLRNSTDLHAERMHIKKDAKKWDKLLGPVMAGIGPMATLVVAGLDVRLGWSPSIIVSLQFCAVAMAFFGNFLYFWALTTNPYFSAVARIQHERGHSVVSSGPYACVRHPGYSGIILFALATPIMLGSVWAFIPVAVTLGSGIIRTALEDAMLQDELGGYAEYSDIVRFRLFPGVW